MKTITLKRGSTLSISGLVKLPAGVWTASSKVSKSNGTYLDTLSCFMTVLPTVGSKGETHSIQISRGSVDTALWPVENIYCDIRFQRSDGVVSHSETFCIDLIREVTNGT